MRYLPTTFAASLCTRKRTAIDGGAHIGSVTSLLLAQGFERVMAIEPGQAFNKLRMRFRTNSSVLPYQVALGDVHNRMVWFGGNHANPKLWHADASRPGHVHMVRFDDQFPPDTVVDLVKLDLEGGELNALKGMSNMLRAQHPVVVCETADWVLHHNDGPGRRDLFYYMAGLGYKIAGQFKGETVWRYPNDASPG